MGKGDSFLFCPSLIVIASVGRKALDCGRPDFVGLVIIASDDRSIVRHIAGIEIETREDASMNQWLMGIGAALGLTAALAPALAAEPAGDPRVGRSYRVPYRLTDTNHLLVRVRIDGKGPFNFLVDTGTLPCS